MIDHVLIGEVVAGFPPTHPNNRSKLRWEYTVKAITSDGSTRIFPYCIRTEEYSGLLNYSQHVLPCSGDATNEAYSTITSAGVRASTVGARCVIACPAGDTRYPVILGLLPHESSSVRVDSPVQPEGAEAQLEANTVYPNVLTAVNGMEFKISEIGEYTITHLGYSKIASKLYKSLDITPSNPAYITKMEFLEKGEWKVSDSLGQMVSLDAELGTMEFGNIENYLYMDQKEKFTQLFTTGNYEEVVGKTRYKFVGDTETVEIKKDQSILIEGDFKREIKKKVEEKVTGEAKYTYDNKFTLKGKTITLDDGTAKLVLKNGKLALGAGSTELVDTLIQVFDQFINNAATIVSTGVGPGVLNPAVVSALTTLKTSWQNVKGSL
jgi:hypothetical protein